MLHLSGGVSLRVDIGDFLELQRAFEGDGVLVLPPDVEEVAGIAIFLRELPDFVGLSEDFADLVRDLLEAPEQEASFLDGEVATPA